MLCPISNLLLIFKPKKDKMKHEKKKLEAMPINETKKKIDYK